MSTETQQLNDEAARQLEKATRAIWEALGERSFDARDSIRRLVNAYGIEFVRGHVERAQQLQTQGGLARPDGSRRTIGGVFFALVKESVGLETYRSVTLGRWQRLKERKKLEREKSQQGEAVATSRGQEAQSGA